MTIIIYTTYMDKMISEIILIIGFKVMEVKVKQIKNKQHPLMLTQGIYLL